MKKVLAEYWEPKKFSRYVEPFAGSACVFYQIRPESALLSDINEELVHFYKTAKAHPKAVYRRASKFRKGRLSYNSIRAFDPGELSSHDRAARFFYLNRYCFNGLYRTNLRGDFNVPYSPSAPGLMSWKTFETAIKGLGNAQIICADFAKTLEKTKKGDFVYLDPPYAVSSRRVFREYGPKHFSLLDLERLKKQISRAEKRGVKFVLSYAFCSEVLDLFKKWHIKKIFVQRNISGFLDKRRTAAEVIVTNLVRRKA